MTKEIQYFIENTHAVSSSMLSDFNKILNTASNISEIIIGVMLLLLPIYLHFYQIRKDKQTLRSKSWEQQQHLNLLSAEKPEIMQASILLYSGSVYDVKKRDIQRAALICYVQLNRILEYWHRMDAGILKKEECAAEAQPILRLLLGSPEILEYCLQQGYATKFKEYIDEQKADVLHDKKDYGNFDLWATEYERKLKSNKSNPDTAPSESQ